MDRQRSGRLWTRFGSKWRERAFAGGIRALMWRDLERFSGFVRAFVVNFVVLGVVDAWSQVVHVAVVDSDQEGVSSMGWRGVARMVSASALHLLGERLQVTGAGERRSRLLDEANTGLSTARFALRSR